MIECAARGMGGDGRAVVRERLRAIVAARPVGSAPADAVMGRAAALYARGALAAGDLQPAIARLESRLRADIPDLVVVRAPRSASRSPGRAAILLCEPRVMEEGGRVVVSAESHAIALTTTGFYAIRGLLPGGAGPHLFERVDERLGRAASLTSTLLVLSRLWPTLLMMRARQRLEGRGTPPSAIVTPFAGGLLFAAVEKVTGMPPLGMTATIVDCLGERRRTLRDWYSDRGDRLWIETKTFVGGERLSRDQRELRDRLDAFTRGFNDVVAEADWRWRIGLGQEDVSVDAVADAFRIRAPGEARRQEAYDALEALVASDLWLAEADRNSSNQKRKRRPGLIRRGR